MSTRRQAVVLLSGGLDSATVLAMAGDEGFEPHALTFDYGQRHRHELDCAVRVAQAAGAMHHVLQLDQTAFRGSALTDGPAVPVDRSDDVMEASIPVTYVPARNTILLSHALGYAEHIGSRDLFIGVNAVDYSGYPDCRPAFIEAFQALANLATRAGVEGDSFQVHAPLQHMDKASIIKKGLLLGVDYGLTSTCYQPSEDGIPCDRCDACILRARGFEGAGCADPLVRDAS
ncbi:MAG: 7-cyano-7-deazaguanine synthase QueC [Phycisphaerales bacterium]|nr:7-cyano-7-deazaguanine synthase QueC [Phycisphaerales bacterium]